MNPHAPTRRRFMAQAGAAAATLAGAAATCLVAAASAAEALPLSWFDSQRQRALPLRLRLPAGNTPASTAGLVPLVLFSHGLGGSHQAGERWARAWAAAGVATLHLQHPGSDTTVLKEGGVRALLAAASGQQLLARVMDVRFVLDELLRRQAEPLLATLALDRIGMAGHSFGAHTTLALAGQVLAGTAAAAEPRLRAFAAFSPAPPAGGRDPVAAFGGITRPVLCLTGSLDTDPLARRNDAAASPDYTARSESGLWRRTVYEALPAGDKAELWLEGADHASFGGNMAGDRSRRVERAERSLLGRRGAPSAELAAHHQRLIEQVSTRWWRAQLAGDSQARAELAVPPPTLAAGDAWRRG